MEPTPEQVRERLERLVPDARRLLVAVSGGVDSVVLLHLLYVAGFEDLHIAHFDHALRPDSAEDAAFVAAVAADLEIGYSSERAEVARIAESEGWNLEDAGRRLRYAFLHRVADEVAADAIVVAHTLDDQAETVLLQLLRGAAYLRGMPARRGMVVRPLLGVPKRDLEAVAARDGLSFRSDTSNYDTSRSRAWLRHELLPLLERQSPGIALRLARLAEHQGDVAAFLRREAARRFGSGALALGALRRAPPALQREAVAGLLRSAGVEVDAERIETALAMIARPEPSQSGPARLTLSPRTALRAAQGRLEVVGTGTPPAEGAILVTADRLPPGVPESVLAHFPELELRAPRPGDRIEMPGGTRKLSDLLIDAKVPREQRPELRVLAAADRIHWVEGLAVSTQLRDLGAHHPDSDLPFMVRALALADEAAAAGELPVGALLVIAGEIVGEGRNRSERDHDPSAHAEMIALRSAAAARGDWRLPGATLYVTLEPCPMCYGAALQAHLERIVFGAYNLREGALGTIADLGAAPWKRRIEVRSGLLAGASSRRLVDFFASRRGRNRRGESD